MNCRKSLVSLLVLAAASLASSPASAQTITTKLIVSGLDTPLWAGSPPGDPRIFIIEKKGIIRNFRNGAVVSLKFLDIRSKTSKIGEQGLLGLAFHPNFANNGYFYVNYTNGAGNTVVSRFTVPTSTPNQADASSELVILTQNQPYSNHNGGWLGFGPNDGYLYIGFGDGGSANDPECRAQNMSTFLGKILRIDVDSGSPYTVPADNPFVGVAGAKPEIWHLGVRNPWRMSFDRLTGDMFIGDVGQGLREEISFAPAGVGGINFGWKVREGTLCNSTTACAAEIPGCASPTYEPPIYQLLHSAPSNPESITGGFVYRGCAIPSLDGTYFFADFGDHLIRSFKYNVQTGNVNSFIDRTDELKPAGGVIRDIASFGEDGFGELLIVEHNATGEVFKIVPVGANVAVNTSRNGSGVNTSCFTTSSQPILGGSWHARIDPSGHAGATAVAIVGYQAPTSGIFSSGGETLVDLASGQIFQLVALASTDAVFFEVPLPCDPTLSGLTAYTQALILGSGWELCNAVDVTLGQF